MNACKAVQLMAFMAMADWLVDWTEFKIQRIFKGWLWHDVEMGQSESTNQLASHFLPLFTLRCAVVLDGCGPY